MLAIIDYVDYIPYIYCVLAGVLFGSSVTCLIFARGYHKFGKRVEALEKEVKEVAEDGV